MKKGCSKWKRIKSLYSLNRLVKSVKHIWENYIPIILEKNGKFFLDINTSQYMMNLNKCKEIIKKHNKNRIDNLDGNNTILSLSGEQLKYWKEMIKGHTILDKLKFDYPETILDKLKR